MHDKIVIVSFREKKFKVHKETFDKFKLDKVKHLKISDNEYYISRDAELFNYVLNYVEYGTFNYEMMSEIQAELKAYGCCCTCRDRGCPFHCEIVRKITQANM